LIYPQVEHSEPDRLQALPHIVLVLANKRILGDY
tara:strand:- start:2859 stop:2960 length:102 start_codon:yes stop_codon:yes gene_type:complete